ncbi:hypothetical protein [Fuscibacter oryzae]|uniref:Lipoprotein n=1 Tax=Fuscibacter oryzae TaxID=2803939 RepID=A0A8J7SVX4_9RHOB|nr:hypothetical protein [Fuscibacter oryzae]MBL4928269.1 hypothetical protein [Fuscibacter oryzae]
MRALIALLALAACTNPSLGVGFGVGAGGVSVSPVVSGTVGGVRTSVSAY